VHSRDDYNRAVQASNQQYGSEQNYGNHSNGGGGYGNNAGGLQRNMSASGSSMGSGNYGGGGRNYGQNSMGTDPQRAREGMCSLAVLLLSLFFSLFFLFNLRLFFFTFVISQYLFFAI
jgi:hypothetical protein